MPTYRTDVPQYIYLYERPSAAAFGVGQCNVAGKEYTSDGVYWSSGTTSTAYTWVNKPTAAEFGTGQAWFSDINAVGYSDSTSWTAPGITKNKNTNLSCAVWRYPLSSTAPLDNSYWVYVPINLTGDYAYFGTGKFSATPNMSRTGIGRIGTQIWNTAGTGVTKTGTWTASTPTGSYAANTYSLTAGETIEFVTRGHTLVSRSCTSTNAGYLIVAIDGDYTRATRLPAFTAADLASSLCRASDVGKRYLNTYAPAVYPDMHILLADDLTDAAHIVTFQVTGTKPAASSAARGYVGGVIGCSASDAGGTINGTIVVAHTFPVNDVRGAGGSAMFFTPEVEKATPNTFEFLGDVHGAETAVGSLSLFVDGVDQSALAAGAYVVGEVAVIETVSTIASTDAPATPVLTKRFSYTYNATYSPYPLVVGFTIDWLVAKRCRYNYPIMLPVGEGKLGTSSVINNYWNTFQIGEYVAPAADYTTNGGAQNGRVQSLSARISSSLHPFKYSINLLDGGTCVGNFRKSSPYNVFLNDRSDGFDKVYFTRSNSFNIESFAVGDVITGTVGIGVSG